MKHHVFRLRRGADLLESIKRYASENGIDAAVILSCVGCLSAARLRDASGVNIQNIEDHMEIVSVTGTVSRQRTHLHIALSKQDLSTIGGHLAPGCIVNTTAEIVLLEIPGMHFSKEFDPETGYNELKIETLQPPK